MKKNLLAENYKRLFKARPSSNDSKLLKESKTPKHGQVIDDYTLVDDGYIGDDDMDGWLDLLADERLPEEWLDTPALKTRVIRVANEWLKRNGYAWQVADALEQNEEGEVTWKIK